MVLWGGAGMAAQQIQESTQLETAMNKAFESNKLFLIEIPINYRYKLWE